MAVSKEVSLRIADYLGINRQIVAEDLQDQYFLQTGNLYERKIGELQPRGGSTLFNSTAYPSNVSSVGQNFTLYDKILGKTDFLKIGCTPQSGTLTDSNLSASFFNDTSNGKWGTSFDATIANSFIGCTEMIIVASGFGIFNQILTVSSGLPVSGDTKSFEVVIAAGGLSNKNITGLEIYAAVTSSYFSGVAEPSNMYVGHINLLANPTGTFIFSNGPLTLGADPGSGQTIGGSTSDAEYTVQAGNNVFGTLTPGKTYWVALLSQYLNYYTSDPSKNRCYYSSYSVQSVTINPGQNSFTVSKNALGSPATLLAVGLHPQTLRPAQVISNSETFSFVVTSVGNPGTSWDTQLGCAKYTPTSVDGSADLNVGQWIFQYHDFAVDEMLMTWDSVTSAWKPIGINNYNFFNTDIFFGSSFGNEIKTVSTGADFQGTQYYSQGQDLIFMVPKANWNPLLPNNGKSLGIGSVVSGSASITFTSLPPNIAPESPIYGPGIPQNTYVDTVVGLVVTLKDWTSTAVLATGSFTNANIMCLTTYIGEASAVSMTSAHNIIHCDGNVASLSEMDFGNADPPRASIVATYQEALVIGGGLSLAFNRNYFTQTQAPFSWGVPGATYISQYFQCESGGEEVTGISLYTNTIYYTGPQAQLMVTKLNTVFVFTTLPQYSSSDLASVNLATMIQLSKKTGCANHKTIVQTEIGTIFTSIDNVWLCRDSGEPVPIGHEISYLLRPEDPSIAIDTSFWNAVYHDGHYKLAYSVNGSSTPTQELWLNIKKMKLQKGQPAWYGPMSGRSVQWQCVEERFNDTIIPKRYCVDGSSLKYYQADYEETRQEFGSDITYTLQPHIMTFKEVNQNKRWSKIYYEMKVDAQFTFTETAVWLSPELGANTQTNSRTVSPIVGYTGSTYANFVNNCRTKLYLFFPSAPIRGENLSLTWTYTGSVLFTIKALTNYWTAEGRRPQ